MPRKIPSPKGTRDLYPEDLLRQRYITEAWRRVSIRHGFEEIAGPTFEMLELYTVKSGEGIVSELFSFRREGGDDDYALRPEFTPTLARMYAAKAASLPSQTKWFTAGPYFRAERPQRGRLREFLQWNCDVIGDSTPVAAVEVAMPLMDICHDLGLGDSLSLRLNDREMVGSIGEALGVPRDDLQLFFQAIDQLGKKTPEQVIQWLRTVGVAGEALKRVESASNEFASLVRSSESMEAALRRLGADTEGYERLKLVWMSLYTMGYPAEIDRSIARGLAYYTGTVFELIADGERAVAGGGRYDNLIELFGGPPTPAVGFGMGDVVLGLLLDDKGLMPGGQDLRAALSQPPASLRPQAFVIADADMAGHVEPLLACLRRGVERAGHDPLRPWASDRYAVTPLHARRSYRAKRKKQVEDASAQFARFTVTINEPGKVELRDMDARQDLTPRDVPGLPSDVADFSVEPDSPVFVGRAIAALLARDA